MGSRPPTISRSAVLARSRPSRLAGAVLIGKLNLAEFAVLADGSTSAFGTAHNSWALEYSTSGSSSGSGAAAAASLVPFSIGTDTGGSIRGPAAFCGIVGLKPTYGRVSMFGVTPLSWSLDHAGPMARTVADAAIVLQAIAGADPRDDSAPGEPVPDYMKALRGDVRRLRIGVPTGYFFDDMDPQVNQAFFRAIAVLQSLGMTTVEIELPTVYRHMDSAFFAIISAEWAAVHKTRIREEARLFDPRVRTILELGQYIPALTYIEAQRVRTLIQREVHDAFTHCDILAVPGRRTLPVRDADGGLTNTRLGNVAGIPAISLPCGFSEGVPSLPMSIMFHAKPFDEATLLRVAHTYESATDWHKRRPEFV